MIDLADVKRWLGNPPEPGVGELLTALEARAVDFLETETERHFGTSESFTEYLHGSDTPELRLNEAPSSITSVHYRVYPGDTWTEVVEGDTDGFEIRAPKVVSGKARLLRKGGGVWGAGYEWRVIYPFGYAAGVEPAQIRQAVLDLVALKYAERGREGLQAHRAGDVSFTVLSYNGTRDITAVPGLRRVIERWRGSAVR